MMVVLSSYILVPFPVPVRWFQANHSKCLNPAKSKFKVIVAVTRAFRWKDLGTRVQDRVTELCFMTLGSMHQLLIFINHHFQICLQQHQMGNNEHTSKHEY